MLNQINFQQIYRTFERYGIFVTFWISVNLSNSFGACYYYFHSYEFEWFFIRTFFHFFHFFFQSAYLECVVRIDVRYARHYGD